MNQHPPIVADLWHVRLSLLFLIALVGSRWTGDAVGAEPIDSPPAERDVDDEVARELAQEVFAGEQYWWKRRSDVKSTSAIGQFFAYLYEHLIRPVLKAIWDLIVWIFESLFGAFRFSTGDWSRGIPFIWTLIAVMALAVVWRLVRLFRRPRADRLTIDAQSITDVLPQADQLLEQARGALALGDHRLAIRLAFLSLLAWLQDRGQLKYDPSRSNREYQSDLRRWPASVACFRAAAEPFERCWYGGRDLNAAQIHDVIALCGKQFHSAKGTE